MAPERDLLPFQDFNMLKEKNMSLKRKLVRVETPQTEQGFLGAGHTARSVIYGDYSASDPFILLMDDLLDKKDDEPAGGPHPHAGFETVSLLLEGEIGDPAHKMKSGDFQMMTAGSGIIHTETIEAKTTMRLLQLWLNLPKNSRWTTPRIQDLPANHAPALSDNGLEIKLYSGSLSGLASPVQNYVPFILADIKMQPLASATLEVPTSYNTFLYVLRGGVGVGEAAKVVRAEQVGWLDRPSGEGASELELKAGDSGVRFVLYSGQPQGDPIVSHGPFIGDSTDDIQRLYREFRQGKMKHISTVPATQRILW